VVNQTCKSGQDIRNEDTKISRTLLRSSI